MDNLIKDMWDTEVAGTWWQHFTLRGKDGKIGIMSSMI